MNKQLGLSEELINTVREITEASCSAKKMEKEELHPNQKVLDKNKNGKIDAQDFEILRGEKSECDDDLDEATVKLHMGMHHVWHKGKKVASYYSKSDAEDHARTLKEAKDGWSQNDSLAKPVTSSQAMANYSHYITKVTKLDSNGNPKKPEKSVKEETEDLDEAKDTLAAAIKRSEAARIRIEKKKEEMRKKGFDDEAIKKHFAEENEDLDEALRIKDNSINGFRLVKDKENAWPHHAQAQRKAAAMDVKDYRKKYGSNTKNLERETGYVVRNEEVYLEDYSLEEIEDFMMTEDFEQLDELSKATLGSYVNKAAKDARIRGMMQTDYATKSKTAKNPVRKSGWDKMSRDAMKAGWKREDGIKTAVGKLTKEQVEEIEILASKHGLGD
jgi:hypothetical protein